MAEKNHASNLLSETHPELLKEWAADKNEELSLDKITSGSGKKAWWRCQEGHEWEAVISNRVKGNGCPYCAGKIALKGKTDLATKHPELVAEWNSDKNGNLSPCDVTAVSGKKVWWRCKKGHEWEAMISNRVRGGNGCPYCAGQWVLKGETDLATLLPDIAKEWDYDKNTGILPDDVTIGSGKKVWWKCKNGHSWNAAVYTRRKSGCPYCANKLVMVGENDLATTNPELLKEWNYERNGKLLPESVTSGSSKVAWWKCSNGHEWKAAISSRSAGHSCPFCSNTRLLVGYNDLATTHPNIIKEWNYSKNQGLTNSKGRDISLPERIMAGSSCRVWWKCSNGHEWQASVSNRIQNPDCPYCSGNRAVAGETDLATVYPLLAKEWNYAKNMGLNDKWGRDVSTPDLVLPSSNQKVWWKCSRGHEWKTAVCHRTKGTKCPYCTKKHAIRGETDLSTTNPELAKEWFFEKNNGLTPEMVSRKSNKKVWWKCSKGHEWQASIYSRTAGNNCPYCAGQRVIIGENDLLTLDPILAEEWNYEKNKGVKPTDVTLRSSKNYWWKCERGHEWKTSTYNRSNGDGCPFCSGSGTSIAEQGVAFYLSSVCVVESRIKISGKEVDIYLPEYKIGIEYDGKRYHSDKEQEEAEKDKVLNDNGVYLIRIKEADCNAVIDDRVIKFAYDGMRKNYEWAVKETCKLIAKLTDDKMFSAIDVNVKRDRLRIRERIRLGKREKSLSALYPELSNEWNYDKNGELKPYMFTPGSVEKVWWKCSKGHQWATTICARVRGTGCPYCAGKRVIRGETDLATKRPEIAREWNYEKNGDLLPDEVMPSSSKKVWWKCPKGHEWESTIYNRSNGRGCPVCKNILRNEKTYRYQLIQRGSLADKYPLVAKEWNYEKNGDLKPENVLSGSGKKVWWKCSNGHEWQSAICKRSYGSMCPYCARNKRKKRVLCVETGIVYSCITEAENKTGVKHIGGCCNGTRKTAGGVHWKYIDEDEKR